MQIGNQYFPDYKLRFFLATAAGRLILRCDLCRHIHQHAS